MSSATDLSADVEYELEHDFVKIIAVVETIGPTGVEMEALTVAVLQV
jgi:molybdenum cofactor biosynthesis enzyme